MKLIKYLLCAFLLIVIGVHFLWLDRFPVGMTHDELEYILSSRHYFTNGTDLSGIGFPLSIIKSNTIGSISFLPAMILSPYYGLVQLNLFTARLPYVLLNFGSACLLFFISFRLFRRQELALLTSLIFLLNPWSFYLSRTATDTPFALFFALLGIFCTVSTSKKSLPMLLSFLAMFFSYHGAKVIFLPLIIASLFYCSFSAHQSLKKILIYIIIGFLIPLSYFVILAKLPNSSVSNRSSDFLTPNSDLVIKTVNSDRLLSINSPIQSLFSNKLSAYLQLTAQKYLSAFSPEVLFISGDQRATYHFDQFGLFYLFDGFFILVGLYFLIKKQPLLGFYFSLLIVFAPLATAISTVETSVVNRSFLLLPLFTILIAYGLWSLITSSPRLRPIFALIIFFLYSLSFAAFYNFYFFRFPLIAQENYYYSQRLLASYLTRLSYQQPVVVISNEPRQLYLETLFFLPPSSIITSTFGPSYRINNIDFINSCPTVSNPDTVYFTEDSFTSCQTVQGSSLAIKNEHYLTPLYFLLHDQHCQTSAHPLWVSPRYLNDYNLPALSTSEFCARWIMALPQ